MSKCGKGKPCGASCISRGIKCRKELGPASSKTLSKVQSVVAAAKKETPIESWARGVVEDLRNSVKSYKGEKGLKEFDKLRTDMEDFYRGLGLPANVPMALQQELTRRGLLSPKDSKTDLSTEWGRKEAADFDRDLNERKLRREGEKSFDDWGGSYAKGSKVIGAGSQGEVFRNPDGTFIKRGAISDSEAKILRALAGKDLGPKLVAADINGKNPDAEVDFVDIRRGRIAMTEVPGASLADVKPDAKVNGRNVADIYWKAMADLHRLGIAHNDAHTDNIFVDPSGKGRWVDFGLSQASPKAALAEAMGIFPPLTGTNPKVSTGGTGKGNWQSVQWPATGIPEAEKAKRAGGKTWAEFVKKYPVAARVWENKPDVQFKLLKMGLSKDDVSAIIAHGIRSTLESYTRGVWSKLTDDQALEVLNTLYDGI